MKKVFLVFLLYLFSQLSSFANERDTRLNQLFKELKANKSNLQISYISKKKLMSKNGNYYNLTLYSLPFLNYINS